MNSAGSRRPAVTHLCYEASLEERDSLMAQLGDWSGYAPTFSRSRPMTIAELRHLVTAAGVEIGAHTENHLWLPKHAAEIQWTELSVGKTRLEGVLGCQVNSLAYPYGAFDSTTVSLAQQAGFVVGVSTEAGPVTT